MHHPLFKNPAFLIWYLLFWIILSTMEFMLDVRLLGATVSVTLVDLIVSNTLFATLGIGMWYIVNNSNIISGKSTNLVLYHLFAMVILLSIWIFVSAQLIKLLFTPEIGSLHFSRVLLSKITFGSLIYILISVFYYTFYYYDRLKAKSKEEARLKELVTQTQLSALKSQINPHFLFNSLNSVSYLTITEPEKAQEMVIKLSNFLRYSLKHKENQMVSIQNEIEHIKLYLDIEKVRFGDKLQSEFKFNGCENCHLPNMILQPLYENAIKYGVYETTTQVTITTNIEKANNNLVFQISNNYDPDATTKKGEGIGLYNIRRRLGLVYGDVTLLKINNENNIFTVTLTLPQNKKK